MGREIPPELQRVLRRLEDITDIHKEKLDFIQDRWTTVRPRPGADPEEVRRAAEKPDASPELKAVAEAVRQGRTTWARAVAGDADHLPEVQAFYAAEQKRFLDAIQEQQEDAPADVPEPRRTRPLPDDPDGPAAPVFDTW
jgi:hypothetical protein